MHRFDLNIALDKYEGVPGETLTGVVSVSVDAAVTARALTICLVNQTDGRGAQWSCTEQQQTLFSGEWTPGDKHEHPFEFTVPNGPVTYVGELLKVLWLVRVSADIPWAIDPTCDHPFTVRPGGQAALSAGPEVNQRSTSPRASGSATVLVIGSLCFFGFASVPLMALLSASDDIGFGLRVGAIVICCLFGLLLLRAAVAGSIAKRKLGDVALEVPSGTFCPGETIPVRVRLKGAVCKLKSATVTLRGAENVVGPSSSSRHGGSTYVHELHRSESTLRGPMQVNGDALFEAEVHLPPDAAATFAAPCNEVRWTVEAHFRVAPRSGWSCAADVRVRPQ